VKAGIKFGASLAVAAVFIYLFVNKLDWLHVWRDARDANFSLIMLATCLMILTYVVRSLRWRALLTGMAAPTWLALFRAVAIGFTALFLLGRAGELLVRPAALSLKEPVKPSASYATVLIERVLDMVTVVIFFAINLAFFKFVRSEPAAIESFKLIRILGVSLLLVSAFGVYGLSIFRRRSQGALTFLDRKLCRLPEPMYTGVMNLLRHISEGLAVLHNAKSLTTTLVYTAVLWMLVVTAYVLVMRAFGIPQSQIPYTGAIFVMGLSMLGSVVPTPGGATGPFHAAAAASLVFLGVERNQAASTAIVLHLVIFLPAVIFGLFYILKEGITPNKLMGRRVESLASNSTRDLASFEMIEQAPTALTNQRAARAAQRAAAAPAEAYRDDNER
jgi:uncharacterized protein (TIRG00374 family)